VSGLAKEGLPQRLGKNSNGYFGETIDVGTVLRDCVAAAQTHGWTVEDIPVSAEVSISAFVRAEAVVSSERADSSQRSLRVYISAGIHGDEPAGPLAVRQLLQEDRWPAGIGLWLCPCLNPNGFQHNRRENAEGIDLNREYLHPHAKETSAHIQWVQQQPAFDLCLCLHEDWEARGFYVYELNPEARPSLAPEIVRRVSRVCPIEISELIEGRPAKDGIIRPSIDPRDRPQWPESF